ncbi:MAG TPA: riboflavin biosynthesis protein RibF [Acidobacteriota bacterium]
MRLRRHLETLSRPSAVAIGNFDGFHAGHRRIIGTLAAQAQRRGLSSVVLTFHPHPRVFFHHPIQLISTDRQRLEILKRQALDRLFFIDFAGVVDCPAHDFVHDVLLKTLRMKVLVVGEDFRWGRGREGDLASLSLQAAAEHFAVVQAPGVEIDGSRVTSSLIRKKLAAGAIGAANRLLEKPYYIDGLVEKGAGRGRKLGFPTMNIATDNQILPCGVFHTRSAIGGRLYESVTNIGRAPTFRSPSPQLSPPGGVPVGIKVESHVPGFRRTIYGETIRLHFIEKIREEREFPSADALVEQIRRDIAFLGI